MKSAFLLATVLAVSAVLSAPSVVHDTEKRSCESSEASKLISINVPLTDWIKNESTDLQWFTTIFVGTPPQELCVRSTLLFSALSFGYH